MPVPQSPSLPEGQAPAIADTRLSVANGFLMLAVGLALLVFSLLIGAFQVALLGSAQFSLMNLGLAIVGIIASFIILNGLVVLQPNTSLVCLLFGSYVRHPQTLRLLVGQSLQFEEKSVPAARNA